MGYAKINIMHEHAKMSFGRWNPRKLKPRKVNDLVKSMENEGCQWYTSDAVLPFVVESADYIDATSITKDLTLGPQLPKLTLTPVGLEKCVKWVMASGQHRVQAVLKYRAAREKKIEVLKGRISKLNAAKRDGFERMEDLKREVRALETEVNSTEFWGVQVIDSSKCDHSLTEVN
jgi:hypothetical protein